MRLSVGTLRQVVKRDLPIAFVPQQLTSYGGLELLRRYVRRIELPRTIATPRRRSRKRTSAYVLRSMRTLRFLLVTRAGRLTRIGGRNVLRLAQNPATEALYARVQRALAT